MNSEIDSLKHLNHNDYANIGRTIQLLSAIEYELLRTYTAGALCNISIRKSATGSFDYRKKQLIEQLNKTPSIDKFYIDQLSEKLETTTTIRNQFAHGIWMYRDGKLVNKFIKRNRSSKSGSGVDLQSIEITPEKFALIQRNLERVLIELDALQKTLNID